MTQNIILNLEPLDLEGNTIRDKVATRKKYKIISGICISIAAIVFLVASLYSAIYYLLCLPFLAIVAISDIFKRKEITKEFDKVQAEHNHKMRIHANNGIKIFDLEKDFSSLGFYDKNKTIYLYQYGEQVCAIPYESILKTALQTYEKRHNYFIGLELKLDNKTTPTFDIILPSYRDTGNNKMTKKVIQERFELHQKNLINVQKQINNLNLKKKGAN